MPWLWPWREHPEEYTSALQGTDFLKYNLNQTLKKEKRKCGVNSYPTLRIQPQQQKELGYCQPEALRCGLLSFVFCMCRTSGLCNPEGWDKMDLSLPVLLREAISRVCEAVPGAKGAFRKRKVLFSQLRVYLCLLYFFSLLSPLSIFNHTQLFRFSFPWPGSCHFFFCRAVGNQETSVDLKGVTHSDSCHF